MTSKVTSGEGVESDDDSSQPLSFMKNTMVTSTMVSGEASETDDEDDADDDMYTRPDDDYDDAKHNEDTPQEEAQTTLSSVLVDTLEVQDTLLTKHEKGRKLKLVYKFDSPFHRKLREKNLQLRSSLVEGTTQLYKSATDKLTSSTFYLTRAQTAVEDVAYQSKIILEDLSSLDNTLQNIVNLQFVPTIKTIHCS